MQGGVQCIDFEKLRLILGGDVEEGDERYAFTWPGKKDAIRQSQTVSMATLRPAPDESVNWEGTQNLYIEGDNLEVLKLLQRGYHGKVKLIYIDPPYNTGHDFVYKDKFGDTIENFREQAGLIGQSNGDTSGRYHSDWCSMMYPRLKLARELLADEGIIAISIDDNEYQNLKQICDEVFGAANHLATIVWQKTLTRRNDAKQISSAHDYIAVYARNYSMVSIKAEEPGEKQRETYKNRDNDPRGDWLAVPFHAPGVRAANLTYPIALPSGRNVLPPVGRHWSSPIEKFNELVADSRIWFGANGDGMPQRKKFWDERSDDEGVVPWTWWDYSFAGENREATKEIKDLFEGQTLFTGPKPTKVIKRVLNLIDTRGGTILDFFSGSSTTADAVLRQNQDDDGDRHFIMVQLPEVMPPRSAAKDAGYDTISQLGEERIRRAGAKIAAEVAESNKQLKHDEEPNKIPDIGFRVLKLDESGIEKPKDGQLVIDRVKPARSDLDIIFEMMLKWGLELTYPIEETDINGYPCYSVAAGELICCMQPGLTVETLEAIAELQPRRVFMMDGVIDDTIKLNAMQIFKRVEEKTQQKIDLRTV